MNDKRSLNLFAAICMMTGCVVGASVFVVPGELAVSVGPAAWVSYLIGAVLMFFNCFIYAQVGAMLPVSGANYMLCSTSVNGTCGFLYVWGFLMANSFLFPIMSRTASTYLAVFFPFLEGHVTTISIVLIVFTIAINMLGTNLSAAVQNACVIILVSVVLIFSGGGIINADWSHFDPLMPAGLMPVVMGAISTYYAFAGVNCVIELSGDIKNPGKNIPRTMFISFGIVVLMYVGMCVGLVALVPANELNVATPAVTAAAVCFPGWFRYFIALASIAACWTTLNAICSSMARLLAMLGVTSVLPTGLAKTNKRGAPQNALLVLLVLAIGLILFSATVMQFVNISSFYLMFITLLVAISSLRVKEKLPQQYESAEYKLKGIWYYLWPALSIVSGLGFMALQLRDDLLMTGISAILLPVGALIYYLRKRALMTKGIDLDQELMKGM